TRCLFDYFFAGWVGKASTGGIVTIIGCGCIICAAGSTCLWRCCTGETCGRSRLLHLWRCCTAETRGRLPFLVFQLLHLWCCRTSETCWRLRLLYLWRYCTAETCGRPRRLLRYGLGGNARCDSGGCEGDSNTIRHGFPLCICKELYARQRRVVCDLRHFFALSCRAAP